MIVHGKHTMDFKVPGNSVLPSVQKIHFQPQPHSQRAWVEKVHWQMFVSGYMGPSGFYIVIFTLSSYYYSKVIYLIEKYDWYSPPNFNPF